MDLLFFRVGETLARRFVVRALAAARAACFAESRAPLTDFLPALACITIAAERDAPALAAPDGALCPKSAAADRDLLTCGALTGALCPEATAADRDLLICGALTGAL